MPPTLSDSASPPAIPIWAAWSYGRGSRAIPAPRPCRCAGHSVVEAADRVGCHFTVAYDWVHRFNESGFGSFEQVPNPKGRPPILKGEQLRELVDVALSSPLERGLPFSNWSVPSSPSTAAPSGCCRR